MCAQGPAKEWKRFTFAHQNQLKIVRNQFLGYRNGRLCVFYPLADCHYFYLPNAQNAGCKQQISKIIKPFNSCVLVDTTIWVNVPIEGVIL